MAGLATAAYNAVFKKTSSLILAAVVGAFFFERTVDVVSTAIFDNNNRGVSN